MDEKIDELEVLVKRYISLSKRNVSMNLLIEAADDVGSFANDNPKVILELIEGYRNSRLDFENSLDE